MSTHSPETVAHTQQWASQTIAWAMNHRATELGATPDRTQAKVIARELWNKSRSECTAPVKVHDVLGKFSRKVLDWSSGHLQGVN